ncbi:MAG TPA: FTR1 family protein [Phycisphaerales bacterium]|nr:FTR1 family protein [Phycisphaerales bacterium]
MILIGGLLPLLLATADTTAQNPQADRAPAVRRIAASAQLAAQEYRLGVTGGRVVAPAEVNEAKLFLEGARKSAVGLGDTASAAALDSLLRLVATVAPADSVSGRVRALTDGIAARFGVTLDELPRASPSIARGAEIYQETCAACHGVSGGGDGPAAAGLDPAPTPLRDWKLLADQSPLDFYRRVSIGVVGTAMPAFEGRLSADDRWAVALYASLLRLPPAAGSPPPALHPFTTSGRMSDEALLEALGASAEGGDGLAKVAAVRARQEDAGGAGAATAEVFGRVRAQVESARALAEAGDPSAPTAALDAYMIFEQVERPVRAKDPALAAELEADFAALRAAAAGSGRQELARVERRLDAGLERAESALGARLRPLNLFVQSFVILLREGLEAILIVGALLTFLVKMGAGHRRRDVHLGVIGAVVASLLTAVALETVFQISPARREALEGLTMVIATVVLFYVSYWLLSKMEVVKWNHFVKSKVHQALTSGSALALASAAFLAVYREGFETVLFYKALFLAGNGSAGVVPVVAGMAVGSVVLAAVYVAIHRFGVRLPLKPFFGVTSAFLYYMAFVFAGQGIAELQEGGLVSLTPVAWAPRIPALGIYPTAESLLAQGVLLALLAVAVVWTFVVEPRRLRVSQVLVPDPIAAPASPRAASPHAAPVVSGPGFELIRSLERMEADLAEMRSEVERMKRYVHELHHSRSV